MRSTKTLACLGFLAISVVQAWAGEVGINDQRRTFIGLDGNSAHDAHSVAVAQDTTLDRHLVVFSADPVDGDFEIFGQLWYGSTGEPVGSAFRISPSDSAQFDALEPAVAFSASLGGYLVVWSGDHGQDGAEEIYAQRVSGNGDLLGSMIRVSSMGSDDTMTQFDANRPDVVFDPVSQRWIIVWDGDDDDTLAVDGDFELFAQALDVAGNEVGSDDRRLFATGPDGDPTYDSRAPSVAVQPDSGIVVVGFDVAVQGQGTVTMETCIFSFEAGTENPSAGPYVASSSIGDALNARHADVVFDPNDGGFVLLSAGDLATDGDTQIFAQRLSSTGDGPTPAVQISGSMSPAHHPAGMVHGADLFVVWAGKQSVGGGSPAEWETYGQLVESMLFAPLEAVSRLSDMGPDGNPAYSARQPVVVGNTFGDARIVHWTGTDNAGIQLPGEQEVYAQRLSDSPTATPEPLVRRFQLEGATPNPFNPSTQIAFDIPASGVVTLKIYDVAGRLVRTLVDETRTVGRHVETWDGRDDRGIGVSSGVYLYRLEAGGRTAADRMVLVK